MCVWSPKLVLDLGAGTGYAIEGLQKRFRKSRILALDFALGMLRQAQRRGSWLNRPRCVCADAEALPLADASVDLVFSNADASVVQRRPGGLRRVPARAAPRGPADVLHLRSRHPFRSCGRLGHRRTASPT